MNLGAIRLRTSQLLEAHRPDDPAGRWVDGFLITLILANVIAIIVETVGAIGTQYRTAFILFEGFSVLVFTVEYLLRLWSCVDRPAHPETGRKRTRLGWFLSPLGLIDLLAILPFYLFLLMPDAATSLLMLRLFRGLRLLRIFKLTRYSPALNVLFTVIRKEARVLGVATFILLVMLTMASWGIYLLERDIQPDEFSSIPAAMWWAAITLTTVGYGDVVPLTLGGRFFAGVVSLVGIGMMALPAAILASGFYREAHIRTQTYQRAIQLALEDGKLSKLELEKLEALREQLGLDRDEAVNSELEERRRSRESKKCPHCGNEI